MKIEINGEMNLLPDETYTSMGYQANPKQWGAVGDGATDDTKAFASAFTSSDVVYIPPGIYYLPGGISIPSNKALIGSGRATILKTNSAQSVPRFITNSDISNGNTNITVKDFAIQLDTDFAINGSNPGIMRLEKVTGLTIENIYTHGTFTSRYTAMDLAGGNRNVSITGCDLKNNKATSSGGALWIRGGVSPSESYNSYNILVSGNILESKCDEAFGVYGWFNTISNVTAYNNIIKNTGTPELAIGILGYNMAGQTGVVQDINVGNNIIIGKTNILTGANRINFDDNIITGPTTGMLDGILINYYGVGAAVPTNVNINNNQIYGSARYGIYASGSSTNIIQNNRFYCPISGGIAGGLAKCINNHIYFSGTKGHGIQGMTYVVRNHITKGQYGIHIMQYASNGTIEDNFISEVSTTGININNNGAAVTNLLITNNKIINDASTMEYGIHVYGAGAYVGTSVLRNKVYGGSVGNITIPSTVQRSDNLVGDPFTGELLT